MAACSSAAVPSVAAPRSFADLSIEELMNIPITSVSKKVTRFGDSAAAVSVISKDDLRLFGINTLPDALRLVPGMDVAQVNSSQWAVSARGANAQFAHKLLVLVDGRNVYTPSFGGVVWFGQDLAIDDLDRIEVIRGPGATLWGANAVNGVVNVISKPAQETQGSLLTTTVGTSEELSGHLRHGGKLGGKGHYRVYFKSFSRAATVDTSGRELRDSWDGTRGGFRADWDLRADTSLTLQGELYRVNIGEDLRSTYYTPPHVVTFASVRSNTGGHLLGRWSRTLNDASHVSLQAFIDYSRHVLGAIPEARDTFDVEFEHRRAFGLQHDVMWGAGYRISKDELLDSAGFVWLTPRRTLKTFTAFLQDEITLLPDRLWLTFGSKFEHNDFTGLETQPSVRLAWTPNEGQTIWGAISHAVTTPSRFQRDARVLLSFVPRPSGLPIAIAMLPDRDLESERKNEFEFGYRRELGRTLSLDLATFYSQHDRVVDSVTQPPVFEAVPAPPHLLIALQQGNNLSGRSYGGEVALSWFPRERVRLNASYRFLRESFGGDPIMENSGPKHRIDLRAHVHVTGALEFVAGTTYSTSLSVPVNGGVTHVPQHLRVDAGIVWRPSSTLELGLWGADLADPHHPEFSSQSSTFITEIPRRYQLRARWRF